MTIDSILAEIGREVARAQRKFPPINNPHEGKAVIEEELDELWKLVKEDKGRSEAAIAEATQIAAMAVRYIFDLDPGWPGHKRHNP